MGITQKMGNEDENSIRLHDSWNSRGNILYLESMKGYYDCNRWGRGDFEDRRFVLRINNSERVAFTHDMQLTILEEVLNNDALPHRFIQNCEKFLHRIHSIKGKRKSYERKHHETDLKQFTNNKLWACGVK